MLPPIPDSAGPPQPGFRARARAQMYLKDPLAAATVGPELIDVGIVGSDTSIADGPRSSRFVVIDYDPTTDWVEPPARLTKVDGPAFEQREHDAKATDQLFEFRAESETQAAQVNAWATAVDVLDMFQQGMALGREIPWAFDGSRLRILPHAMQEPNAFYSRKTRALHFGYFPGKTGIIRTALSHDIVAHETAHAVLDGLRPFYLECPHPDAGAFHEFVGDMAAMLSLFRNDAFIEVLKRNARQDAGDFKSLIADLAPEVGLGVYGNADRSFLRSAANDVTFAQVQEEYEPHRRSQLLSGLVFKMFGDIFRLRQNRHDSKGTFVDIAITARHLVQMFLRVLDFLPPGGVSFSDYVAILLEIDKREHPDDRLGYRRLLQAELERRGLVASTDLLISHDNRKFIERDYAMIRSSRVGAYRFLDANRGQFNIPANVDFRVVSMAENARETDYGFRPPRETILQFVWDSRLKVEGPHGQSDLGDVWLRNGGTVVIDERVNVLFCAMQRWEGKRLEEVRQHLGALVKDGQVGFDFPRGVRSDRSLVLSPADGAFELRRNMARFHSHRSHRAG